MMRNEVWTPLWVDYTFGIERMDIRPMLRTMWPLVQQYVPYVQIEPLLNLVNTKSELYPVSPVKRPFEIQKNSILVIEKKYFWIYNRNCRPKIMNLRKHLTTVNENKWSK